jgi:hypothetical protein
MCTKFQMPPTDSWSKFSQGFRYIDRLWGLVVRVLGYRSGGPGSISGTTRKKSSGSGTGSTQPREYNWGAIWYKSSGSCLENREYGRRDPSRWPRGTYYPQKLAITSPSSGGRSVGIVRSRTQAMEFFPLHYVTLWKLHHQKIHIFPSSITIRVVHHLRKIKEIALVSLHTQCLEDRLTDIKTGMGVIYTRTHTHSVVVSEAEILA